MITLLAILASQAVSPAEFAIELQDAFRADVVGHEIALRHSYHGKWETKYDAIPDDGRAVYGFGDADWSFNTIQTNTGFKMTGVGYGGRASANDPYRINLSMLSGEEHAPQLRSAIIALLRRGRMLAGWQNRQVVFAYKVAGKNDETHSPYVHFYLAPKLENGFSEARLVGTIGLGSSDISNLQYYKDFTPVVDESPVITSEQAYEKFFRAFDEHTQEIFADETKFRMIGPVRGYGFNAILQQAEFKGSEDRREAIKRGEQVYYYFANREPGDWSRGHSAYAIDAITGEVYDGVIRHFDEYDDLMESATELLPD